jgi:hypothetical protein
LGCIELVHNFFKLLFIAYSDKSGLFVIALLFKYVNAAPEPTILPAMFNDDGNVDALETNKLVKLVLLFKLLIDNVELVDRLFK